MLIMTEYSSLGESALLAKLNSRNWKYYTPVQRLALLQEVENRTARRQGREARRVRTFVPVREKAGVRGYYSDGEPNCIYLSEKYVDGSTDNFYNYSVAKALSTLLHEGRHAYQDDVIKGRCPAPDEMTRTSWRMSWLYNGESSSPEGEALYAQQSIERDARGYAMKTLPQLYEVMKNATGCEDFEYLRTFEWLNNREASYYELARTVLTRRLLDEVDRRLKEMFVRLYPFEKLPEISAFDEIRRLLDRAQVIQEKEVRKFEEDDISMDKLMKRVAERAANEGKKAKVDSVMPWRKHFSA